MRATVCSFLFLAVASLAQAQIHSIGPGQIPCKQFADTYQKYVLEGVRPALELAMHGGKAAYGGGIGYVDTSGDTTLQMLGDGRTQCS